MEQILPKVELILMKSDKLTNLSSGSDIYRYLLPAIVQYKKYIQIRLELMRTYLVYIHYT